MKIYDFHLKIISLFSGDNSAKHFKKYYRNNFDIIFSFAIFTISKLTKTNMDILHLMIYTEMPANKKQYYICFDMTDMNLKISKKQYEDLYKKHSEVCSIKKESNSYSISHFEHTRFIKKADS